MVLEKIVRSKNKGMITRAQGFVLVHNNVQQATQTDIINLTPKTNKQEIVLPEVCSKSFCWPSLLPTKHNLNRVTKSGVLQLFPP
jgi:hypothetical protein